MQERIKIDGAEIKQPDAFNPNFETTYTEDSGRVMSGVAELDPMFTVESYSMEWSYLTPDEASEILKKVIPTQNKPTFTMTYFSWYHGEWRTGTFYVGKGSLKTKTLRSNYEFLESISFNVIGVNPL